MIRCMSFQASSFGAFLDVLVDNVSRGTFYVWAFDGPTGAFFVLLEMLSFLCTHKVRFGQRLSTCKINNIKLASLPLTTPVFAMLRMVMGKLGAFCHIMLDLRVASIQTYTAVPSACAQRGWQGGWGEGEGESQGVTALHVQDTTCNHQEFHSLCIMCLSCCNLSSKL